jgi:prevent-host-death family protein
MLRMKEGMAVVGVAELRREGPRLIGELRRHKVVLTRRNKPVGVLINYEDYLRMQSMTERLENLVLGHEAKKRASRRGRKVLSLDEAERRVGLR